MKRNLGVCCILLLTGSALLADKVKLIRSEMVPAATGEVEVGHDKNKNTEIEIKVEHLAKPKDLTPPKTTYVVWIQSPTSNLQNAGQLTVSDDLKGEFKTVTPLPNFDVLITAEDNPDTVGPPGEVVLHASVSR